MIDYSHKIEIKTICQVISVVIYSKMDSANHDILHEILCNLTAKNVICCMHVCKIFYNICKSQILWRKLLKIKYDTLKWFDNDDCYTSYRSYHEF